MDEQFSRTELLYGHEAIEKLKNSRVLIFGVGGVGGFCVEALIRSGIGHIDIVDNDQVAVSNLNRQIIATKDTIGRDKVDVMEERILSINPDCEVVKHKSFYLPETRDEFDFSMYDYVIDAIDTVTGKIDIIVRCDELGIPVISAMGAGNKIHPSMFEVADIYETSVCPLAKVMRRELKKRGVKKCKVVYSKEEALKPLNLGEAESATVASAAGPRKKATPGSTAFSPSVAGLIMASEVINDLTGKN
ncbi:MAG: tRNA threonylcarbamoyladenosine dehydratase [Lachnospiraceae bacterium]|nr:tRNA threonylcarbamoyladenosine dehydratase [Lachnospiraceae bacterium]